MTLRGQKPVTVYGVKYVENGKSYDVGPNRGYVDISSLDRLPKIFSLFVYFLTLRRALALSSQRQSARMLKIKNIGLDQYGKV